MSNPNQAAAEGGSVIAHAVADFVTDAGTVRHCLLTHCRSRHPPQVTSRARLSGDPRAVLTHVSPEFAPVEAARGERGQAAELICHSPRGTSAARR
jgi:hypothetical protein